MTRNHQSNSTPTSMRVKQVTLPLVPSADECLEVAIRETWLGDAACAIRGATAAPKFKDFILPLIFYKCLSNIFDNKTAEYVTLSGAVYGKRIDVASKSIFVSNSSFSSGWIIFDQPI